MSGYQLFPHHPFLIIISSPSGAGKSTICRLIIKNDPRIKLSISATTRPKRDSEIHAQDYYFLSPPDFQKKLAADEFLEHATVFDHHYGTPKKMVQDEKNNGCDVLFDIDWQGARQIKAKFKPEEIISIFLLPPSLTELENRLKKRASDSDEILLRRMNKAKDEISHFDEYEYVVVNYDIDETYRHIKSLIEAKRASRAKRAAVADFVEGNLLRGI